MRLIGIAVTLAAAAALTVGVLAEEPAVATKKVCTNTSCVADACPAGTATQHGACRCNLSCGCTGSIKCYDGAGVLIATKTCSGSCDWVAPAPPDPEPTEPAVSKATESTEPVGGQGETPVVADQKNAKEPTRKP